MNELPPKKYFETKDEIASYLGVSPVEFLKMVSDGRFPVRSKPKDPTQIWYLEDVIDWQKRKAMLRGEG